MAREHPRYHFMLIRPATPLSLAVIMPTSALARLTQMDIASPYLFQISPHGSDNKTHAGVLEFIADEGNVHLPAWVSPAQLSDTTSSIHSHLHPPLAPR